MDAYGKIDILICNAGILRDKSFAKMEQADFDLVMQVHVWGTFRPIKAVWEIMKAQNYGRIVVTTSSSGMYGNFGQANYGAAKMAVLGLMNTLKIEGQKNNIHINAISPVAATRMTENLMPPAVLEKLKPEYVTPGVVYLGVRRRSHGRDPDGGRRAGSPWRASTRPKASTSATTAFRWRKWRRTGRASKTRRVSRPISTAANKARNSSARLAGG